MSVLPDPSNVRIAGRRAAGIKHGGRTTYPREREDLLRTHPAVHDAGIVAVPRETLGEPACAGVVATEGSIVTGDESQAFCRETVADHIVPDLVCFCDAFALPASGKVTRMELAQVAGLELRITT